MNLKVALSVFAVRFLSEVGRTGYGYQALILASSFAYRVLCTYADRGNFS